MLGLLKRNKTFQDRYWDIELAIPSSLSRSSSLKNQAENELIDVFSLVIMPGCYNNIKHYISRISERGCKRLSVTCGGRLGEGEGAFLAVNIVTSGATHTSSSHASGPLHFISLLRYFTEILSRIHWLPGLCVDRR